MPRVVEQVDLLAALAVALVAAAREAASAGVDTLAAVAAAISVAAAVTAEADTGKFHCF